MKNELETLLAEVLPMARFNVRGRVMALSEYRAWYARSRTNDGIHQMNPSSLIYADPDVSGIPEGKLHQLTRMLRALLEPYIDPSTSQVGFVLPSEASDNLSSTPDIDLLTKWVIRCAALGQPARATDLLFGCIEGEPVRCTKVMVLHGVYQEQERFDLEPNVRFVRQSLLDTGLSDMIPDEIALKVVRGSDAGAIGPWVIGTTMLCIDYDAPPPLRQPRDMTTSTIYLDKRVSLEPPTKQLIQALSLACDESIDVIYKWINFDHELASLTSCYNQFYSSMPYWNRGHRRLTPDLVDRTGDLWGKLRGPASSRTLQLAVQRWMKSRATFDPVDQSIDVRVALEALFCQGEGNAELSLRLALRGAWYMGSDGPERRQYFDTLRKAYRMGSRAVHAGDINEAAPTVPQLLSESRNLCRDAILKRLDAGEEPDWTALVLDA